MSVAQIKNRLRKIKDPEKAAIYQRFFKTGKGQYGYGDRFIGVTVPKLRKISKEFKHLALNDIRLLLTSPIHEERLLALFIMIIQFTCGTVTQKQTIFNEYITHLKYINNWDLVDISAYKIMGAYLFDKDKDLIYELARSENLWERRIAVMTTFYFIKASHFEDTLNIAEILLQDPHDLIHKAVGWMLREIGKIDIRTEEKFLAKYYHKMPRTMLRYAIERFPPEKRKAYLHGNI